MVKQNQDRDNHPNSVLGVLIGVLVGGLAGAITMLLLAPQSGKDTRTQIQNKGIELRDRTSELVEDAKSSIRQVTNKITKGANQKVEELLQTG